MNQRLQAALRLSVLAVTGYLSLATSGAEDWFVESAHVDLPLGTQASTARIRVTLDADTVVLVAPAALAIQSSSGRVWTADDEPLAAEPLCARHHRSEPFCEEVPYGRHVFDYELLLAAGMTPGTTRLEVLAGGGAGRIETPGGRFGVSIEVLP